MKKFAGGWESPPDRPCPGDGRRTREKAVKKWISFEIPVEFHAAGEYNRESFNVLRTGSSGADRVVPRVPSDGTGRAAGTEDEKPPGQTPENRRPGGTEPETDSGASL